MRVLACLGMMVAVGLASVSAQGSGGWDAGMQRALQLRGAGKLREAAVLVRRLVEERPARVEGHVLLAEILGAQHQPAAAARVLRAARVRVLGLPAIYLLGLSRFLVEQVQQAPELSRRAAGVLLDEARVVADEVIRRIGIGEAVRPRSDLATALRVKGIVLELQAQRVERSDARKQALVAESTELWARAQALADEDRPQPSSADGAPRPRDVDLPTPFQGSSR